MGLAALVIFQSVLLRHPAADGLGLQQPFDGDQEAHGLARPSMMRVIVESARYIIGRISTFAVNGHGAVPDLVHTQNGAWGGLMMGWTSGAEHATIGDGEVAAGQFIHGQFAVTALCRPGL